MNKIASVLSALVFLVPVIYCNIINVPGNYATIQSAINASVNGDTIIVETGTYTENINFRGRRIVLTSRYFLTGDPSTVSATIINGSNPSSPDSGSCVRITSGEDSTTVLQGFSITGGSGTKWMDEHGAGLFREGGGVLIAFSNPIIKDNVIFSNVVLNNTGVVSTGGGGMRIGDCYARVYNNIIMNNTGKYGAGIVLNFAGGEYKNNIICSNYGSNAYGAGSGMWINGVSSRPKTILNNTIVNNSAQNGCAGVYGYGGVSAIVINNIIWGNTVLGNIQVQGNLAVTYCDVQGGYFGSGNINIDPVFADSNFILTTGSACVDKGDSSTIYNDLPDQNNPSLARYPSRGTLRNDMGAYGGPLSKILTNSLIGISRSPAEVPDKFLLMQNYPNPFNPVTSFKIAVSEQSFVNITIFDVLGRKISIPVNQYLQPGIYKVDFNAAGLPSGVYFYRFTAGSFQQTRKMILAK